MELWIRSKNKMKLVKVTNGIYINKCYENGHTNGYEITCGDGGPLGIYNEERALEVLDEIQNIINSSVLYQEIDSIKIMGKSEVYEMPKE